MGCNKGRLWELRGCMRKSPPATMPKQAAPWATQWRLMKTNHLSTFEDDKNTASLSVRGCTIAMSHQGSGTCSGEDPLDSAFPGSQRGPAHRQWWPWVLQSHGGWGLPALATPLRQARQLVHKQELHRSWKGQRFTLEDGGTWVPSFSGRVQLL